jgi:hypothetical protein
MYRPRSLVKNSRASRPSAASAKNVRDSGSSLSISSCSAADSLCGSLMRLIRLPLVTRGDQLRLRLHFRLELRDFGVDVRLVALSRASCGGAPCAQFDVVLLALVERLPSRSRPCATRARTPSASRAGRPVSSCASIMASMSICVSRWSKRSLARVQAVLVLVDDRLRLAIPPRPSSSSPARGERRPS